MTRWFGRAKRRLGYYRLRARLREPRFRRGLRPTDVFLVGHPKSGNTWLAYMLAILLFRDRKGEVTLLDVGRYVPVVHGRDHRIDEHEDMPDPRIFRDENPQHWPRYPRILYLIRDPRAVLVSFWHMYRTMFDDTQTSLESFVDQYLTGTGCFTRWNRHLVRWDRQVAAAVREAGWSPGAESGGGRIRIVRYEDLVSDRRGSLERLVEFLGIERAVDNLELAAERGSFEAMRETEDRHGAEAYEGRALGRGRFVRSGTIDGWKAEMDPALAAGIEAELGGVMRQVGYLD